MDSNKFLLKFKIETAKIKLPLDLYKMGYHKQKGKFSYQNVD